MKLFNLSTSKIFKYFYLIISIVCFVIFIFISLFLYQNFYKTITQTEEIMVLRREVATEDINMNLFDRIIDRLSEKVKEREIELDINF